MVETVVYAPAPLGVISSVESLDTRASTPEPPAWTTTTSPLRLHLTVPQPFFLTANVTPKTTTNSAVGDGDSVVGADCAAIFHLDPLFCVVCARWQPSQFMTFHIP